MGLQTQLKDDLKAAMKDKDEEKKSILRVIMGEFGRLDKKEIPDDEVIQIIKKLVKAEKEVLAQSGQATNRFVEVAESYLPQMASEEEIAQWISANVDFSQFKNKMQAMKPIMAHFGASVDGNTVKKVLQSL